MNLTSVSIIVSSEKVVEFYKGLGFKETGREIRKEMHDELISLSNGNLELKLYKDATHPIRNRKPESLGIRFFTLEVDSLNAFGCENPKEDNQGKFIFLNDPDGQPVQIREKK